MNIINVEHLYKIYGEKIIFDDASFGIQKGDKIGIVGINGTGKSTLLKMIAGEETPDKGQIIKQNGLNLAYVPQNPVFSEDSTIRSYALKKGEENWKVESNLTELNITRFDQKIEHLSGGQKKRVVLAKILSDDFDVLLLDEPTNHLDNKMSDWLENYLKSFRGVLLMVTHDRYFLDRVCSEIIEIDRQQLFQYKGNYSYYLEKRQERVEATNTEIERANNLLRKELDWMRRQPQARGTKAKYRIDAFYDLEAKAKQQRMDGNVSLEVKASYIGSKIFEAVKVSKSFGNLQIVKDFDYVFARYEKMGIVGNNGTGKSTFIKMLMGEVEPDSGGFDVGETVRFGYYSQDGLQFDEQMKVIDVVQDLAEFVQLGDGKTMNVSQFLTYFMFSVDKQHNFVYKLSGGEKRRLYLCTVLMRNPNFLVLDEPTNDLDIVTLNVLEEYLRNFKGCVIVVSHDRYFMDKVVDHLLVFKGNADIQDFPGNYTQYREWKEIQSQNAKAEESAKQKLNPPTEKVARSSGVEQKKKLSFNERREFEALEAEISSLETEKSSLETALSSGSLSNDDLMAKSQRIAELLDEIDEKTMRWLELSEWA